MSSPSSTSLGQDLPWTRLSTRQPHAAVFSSSVINTLNVFKPQAFLYRIPVPGYDRLTKKFTPTYLSLPRRCRNRLDNRK